MLTSLVPTLGKSESAKRLASRSRLMPIGGAPQSTSKSSRPAPLVGDLSDTGPKEPPILVTPSESFRYPLDPCFVFLQLYHASFLGPVHEKPQPLPDGEVSCQCCLQACDSSCFLPPESILETCNVAITFESLN